MADNITAKANTGSGTEVLAADDIGGVLYPRSKIVIGADGVNGGDVSSANPMPIQVFDPAIAVTFGPIAIASTPLFTAVDTVDEASVQIQLTGTFSRGGVSFQYSNDNVTFHGLLVTDYNDDALTDAVYGPTIVTMPVVGKYFRAVTTPDFAGSVSGAYILRNMPAPQRFTNTRLAAIDTDILLPVAGTDSKGNVRRFALSENGGVFPAETTFTGSRNGAQAGTIVQVDTTGYNSVAMQLAGTFTGTVTFQASNDGTTWASVTAWPVAGGTAPVSTATAVGQWLIPAAGRFIRAQLTTAGSGFPLAIAVLKNAAAFYPASTPSVTIAANSAVNVAQIGGTATATATGVPIAAGTVASGASVSTLIAAGSNNLTQLKSSIGRLYLVHVQNQVASVRYLKLFNLPSASVTMGVTSANMNFVIPASGTLNLNIPSTGLSMGGTGITFALTTGSSLTDNSAVTAADLICNFSWA
jgi:hypothetical protein